MAEAVMIGDIGGISDALGLGDHELVSLVGGGGKTTVLFALGTQLAGRVVLTTTTKMGRERMGGHEPLLAPTDEKLLASLRERRVVLAWRAAADHKALGVEPQICDCWFGLADHVVVEADGSRRMPFKAPLDYEPVVPSETTTLVACVGAAALGAVISEGCQRPERVAAIAGCSPEDQLTPQRLAAVLLSDQGSRKDCPPSARFAVVVNQVRAKHHRDVAELAGLIAGQAQLACIAPFSPQDSPELFGDVQ
ncbi:MAG: selenium cofactor biosynthesis protein YqeC [Acidimicrobiaceae bacterium]|nr:selenium cofactor biosynthesis protein YqeC [Acidimicrobiaceae bacterium]